MKYVIVYNNYYYLKPEIGKVNWYWNNCPTVYFNLKVSRYILIMFKKLSKSDWNKEIKIIKI